MDNKQILESLDDIVIFREEPTSEQIEALMEAMDIVEKYSKIGVWIPCSEPPKHDKEVLIFNGKSYSVGYYDGKTWVNTIRPVEWQEIQHE